MNCVLNLPIAVFLLLSIGIRATAGQPYAAKFIDFIVSEEGQNLIRSFGADKFGKGLYNDAEYTKQYDR